MNGTLFIRGRVLAFAAIIGSALATCVAQATDLAVISSGNWTNSATWKDGVFPSTNDNVYVVWGSYTKGYTVTVDNAGATVRNLYLGQSLGGVGVLQVEPGALFPVSNIYDGQTANCTGSVVQTGGTITNAGAMYVGNVGHGHYLISGGTNYSRYMYVGAQGSGIATQTAGRVETTRLYLGNSATTVGAYYEISGGSLNASDSGGGLRLGTGGAQDCRFKVVGTNPVISAAYYFQTNSVLHVVLKEGGVSPITINGNALIKAGSELRLEVDPTRYTWNGSDNTVMSYSGTLTGTFSATNIVTRHVTCDGIQYDTPGKAIRLLNVRYTPPGTIISVL